jgi:hypothetical protein
MLWSRKLYPELEAFVDSAAARNFRPQSVWPSGRRAPAAGDAPHSGEPRHPGLLEAPPEAGGPGHALLCLEAAIQEFFQLVCM